MPGFLMHTGATAMCPHGGTVSVVTINTRVLASGQPLATAGDTCLVTGCPFMVGNKPQPCVKVQWLVPSARVLVNGQPAILQTSSGLCLSPEQIPQGPPNVIATQTRVRGI